MAEFTPEDRAMLQVTHDTVIKLATVIGNGDSGLCKDIRDGKADRKELWKATSRLRTTLYCLIYFLIGSGVITGGVFGLEKLLK